MKVCTLKKVFRPIVNNHNFKYEVNQTDFDYDKYAIHILTIMSRCSNNMPKSIRLAYDIKIIEAHIDKHNNLIYRQYEEK